MSPQKLLIVFVFVFEANARICENVYANNYLRKLENELRGCTVVVGNLKVALFERNPDRENININNITFPELTEITGFLLLYRVYGLTSIGTLFPNLAVIRGDSLITDYSLIVRNLPDLKEIGLFNLQRIERGSTRIENCPNLCFVDTIDWAKIGAPLHEVVYNDENVHDCAFCPTHCNGTCWNSNNCQIIQEEECLVYSKSDHNICKACRTSYLDEGKCVDQCPETKLRNSVTRTCITPEECSSIPSKKWYQFQGGCMKTCPQYYKKVSKEEGWCQYCGEECYHKSCNGGILDSLGKAEDFRDCTHIKGSLVISVNTATLANELENILGRVREIDGSLKIYRSQAISSLYFLKKLKLIRGEERHSLLVYENQNLRKLWNWNNFTLKIERGNLFFHYNPILCLAEIHKLVDVLGMPDYNNFDISPYSNGDRTVCRHINLKVRLNNFTSTKVTVNWETPVVEVDDLIVGYSVHYIVDSFKNITLAYGRDVCYEDQWLSKFISKNNVDIVDLYPYTQYAFYIQVHTMSSYSGGFTNIQYFATLQGEPSEPTNIRVILTTTDSIILTWDPPTHPAGKKFHYKMRVHLEEDDLLHLKELDYCFQPRRSFQDPATKVEDPLEVWTNSSSSSCCRKQNWQEWKRTKRSNDFVSFDIFGTLKHEIKDLRHFKIYTILLAACNDLQECSSRTLIYQRTQPKIDADDIPPGVVAAVKGSNISVKWLEPITPNTEILSYLLEYKRVDLNNSVNNIRCIKSQDYKNHSYGHTITNLSPGKYLLTVKAVSLAGPGRPSETVMFEIPILERTSSWAAYLITIITLFAILLSSGLFYYYRSKKSWMLLHNLHSPESVFGETKYELLRGDIDIPQSTFGIICNGLIKSQNCPCTVKVTQNYNDRRELNKFLKDALSMKHFTSYHIVNLLGIVSKNQPAMVVMELMAWGDLKSFLKQSENLTHNEMYRMAAEIADGMMYLSSKKFIHSDLAARNCLVSAGQTVKLINFGINKDLYKTDYYTKKTGEVIPVRWMAPESLADGIFSPESNVWSYGIILWEIATLARQPYENLVDQEVIRYVIGQKVLEPPPNCPELLYEMMVACWRWRSKHRPIFVNLLKQLQSHVRRDFKLVSFYHSREATEYKLAAKNREYNLPARRIPLLDEKPSVRWNKRDDEIELCPTDDVNQDQSENVASTSSHI